ncbi:CatB-related O-acetyltransferase [Legionella micdadei]|uniref:Chloramphenicol acetyltransferase n=1 Tax=Legionella micdadei TaxID=451 RepID=A0A098GJA1_LEGMI|nr:CatB-related O-acetyltransferase [Legionella micdadei]ARG97006.1 antibiotic acetyltransferase [Legionella micdadei]ARH00739.1 antibiotic acetyltransferase [Legionella micdadei]KTD26720.1 chloramphenicol acetyltransferase [Legionella micdadei]NSL18225.1 CatB-related O-acetyltransferase [Legionella micdadei]CEG61581.1 Chloramphenicol acetyltransferase [Legionella micdadei]
MTKTAEKHWSLVEFLHESVRNPNIHIKGKHSYYSNAWTGSFEDSVVRYLYGDQYSLNHWEPQWQIDQLYIGDYVCIAAEAIIMLGGNHNHRMDWFCLYPFADYYAQSYEGRGDTVIKDGVWLGMRSIIMPGVTIGEGAIVAANSVVTKDVEPYSIVAGSPAKLVKKRFEDNVIERIQKLDIYSWDETKFNRLKRYLCSNDIDALEEQHRNYDAALI